MRRAHQTRLYVCHMAHTCSPLWVSYGNPICAQFDPCSCENLRCYIPLTYIISIWLAYVINVLKATSMCICIVYDINMCCHIPTPLYGCCICLGPYDSHMWQASVAYARYMTSICQTHSLRSQCRLNM